ncbi:polysaccharide deacetylase family protein [Pleionea sediminis]|uniref:polysaccharide deacetylase family protein n=1 Tax=Pleionea sediminis TaxID=2569479 RepID=UPI0013DDC137|nr:polysaccharide deacetylase family protein [Pleionea sediminis]
MFRKLTSSKLRILCYHGVSLDKEHEFFDKLFITRNTFEKRMKYLKSARYPVITLDEGVKNLKRESYPDCATVITFDDGWSGVYSEISEFMYSQNLPWTLYLSTYYVDKQTQVFNIVFQYLLGVTSESSTKFEFTKLNETKDYDLSTDASRSLFYDDVYNYANNHCNAKERQQLLVDLMSLLKVDAKWIFDNSCFKYVTIQECQELVKRGVAIELHTHRHTFPPDNIDKSKLEILENRKRIIDIVGENTHHFCYPSGVYAEAQFEMMRSIDVHSATTVKAGLNDSSVNVYELNRFLDSESIKQIEFEAEMCGFATFIRKVLR